MIHVVLLHAKADESTARMEGTVFRCLIRRTSLADIGIALLLARLERPAEGVGHRRRVISTAWGLHGGEGLRAADVAAGALQCAPHQ